MVERQMERDVMRIGLMLAMPGEAVAVQSLVDRAAAAERSGFASCWLPQASLFDALTTIAVAGAMTDRIELGTAVVPTYPRHPVMLAEQALTVQAATAGRLALGIGLSHRFIVEDRLGLDYSRPIPHMRDYLNVLSPLLAGETVDYDGPQYRVNASLSVVGAVRPPLLVAALGPAMLRLCGRLADGTITWMAGPEFLRDIAVPTMTSAATEVGRTAPRFVGMVPVLLTNDVADGRAAVDAAFGRYGEVPSYRATLDRGGADRPSDVAVVGDPEAIRSGLDALADAGLTDLVAVVPREAPSATATIELLGELAVGR